MSGSDEGVTDDEDGGLIAGLKACDSRGISSGSAHIHDSLEGGCGVGKVDGQWVQQRQRPLFFFFR